MRRIHRSQILNAVISIAWVITWAAGGLFVLFYLNARFPLVAELLLPLYFLLWIALLLLGSKAIERWILTLISNLRQHELPEIQEPPKIFTPNISLCHKNYDRLKVFQISLSPNLKGEVIEHRLRSFHQKIVRRQSIYGVDFSFIMPDDEDESDAFLFNFPNDLTLGSLIAPQSKISRIWAPTLLNAYEENVEGCGYFQASGVARRRKQGASNFQSERFESRFLLNASRMYLGQSISEFSVRVLFNRGDDALEYDMKGKVEIAVMGENEFSPFYLHTRPSTFAPTLEGEVFA